MNPSVSSVVKPVQRSFDLGLKTGRPTLSVNAAMSILDQDEDAVGNLIELGFIAIAVDIRSPKSQKKEVRIFADSLRAYLAGEHLSGTVERSIDVALKSLFKHSRPHVRGVEIRRALNCSSQHVLDLLKEGCFTEVPNVQRKTPKTSPTIYRSSVITFLKSRREPQ